MLYLPILSASLSASGRAKNCAATAKVSSTRRARHAVIGDHEKPGVFAGARDGARERRCGAGIAGEIRPDVEHRNAAVTPAFRRVTRRPRPSLISSASRRTGVLDSHSASLRYSWPSRRATLARQSISAHSPGKSGRGALSADYPTSPDRPLPIVRVDEICTRLHAGSNRGGNAPPRGSPRSAARDCMAAAWVARHNVNLKPSVQEISDAHRQ